VKVAQKVAHGSGEGSRDVTSGPIFGGVRGHDSTEENATVAPRKSSEPPDPVSNGSLSRWFVLKGKDAQEVTKNSSSSDGAYSPDTS
jgi:hypothetical protein